MPDRGAGEPEELSPLWRKGVLALIAVEFAVLIAVAVLPYRKGVGPPMPARIVDQSGATVLTRADIIAGQQVFLEHGLMDNGTLWGHGAYLGPDFSAAYLHALALAVTADEARRLFDRPVSALDDGQRLAVRGATASYLERNLYNSATGALVYRPPEVATLKSQLGVWRAYFAGSAASRGLPAHLIPNTTELRELVAFFSWAAWATVAHRPGLDYSYTNNFPYDPTAGNGPSSAAILWSALSLIGLLAALALVLLSFGRFHWLGWHSPSKPVTPQLIPGAQSPAQRATLKFFVATCFMLLVQVLIGGAMAHFEVEPKGFYGFNLAALIPSSVLRGWHLQLAIFWIATSFMGAGLYIASALGKREPRGQAWLINLLFAALVLVVAGSLVGEWMGVRNMLGKLWYWLGDQGWEYLEIGRAWQILLALGMAFWAFLLIRAVRPREQEPENREMAYLFLIVALAIPFFYLPAFFFGSASRFTIVDTWRFWIIHLWVEGFFELFATVMVALIFVKLGLVRQITAKRVIYLDAVLFLGAGILGTGHHWYWTGQTTFSMALSATFSAMEVVPLVLLTLEAGDFVGLLRGRGAGKFPHRWAFYYLIAVGVWNFIGAGIFGFLINLPIVSYYEAGTDLTANHAHGALMGVFGMLALAFVVLVLRQRSSDEHWRRIERLVAVSFWCFNIGLAGMLVTSLFPTGVLQVWDVIRNGYWHARSPAFSNQPLIHALSWVRLPSDLVFILGGAVPLAVAAALTYVQDWWWLGPSGAGWLGRYGGDGREAPPAGAREGDGPGRASGAGLADSGTLGAIEVMRMASARPARKTEGWPIYHVAALPGEGVCMPYDANGCLYWEGRYHLMYIFQRADGAHCWGHLSSADLLHWTYHPTALEPLPGDPDTGIFSGNAFVNRDGVPMLCWFGIDAGVCVATAEDDDLIRWRKHSANPVLPIPREGEPGFGVYTVWDPYLWLEGDTYFCLLGGNRLPNDHDTVYLCTSTDLVDWAPRGPLYEGDPTWTRTDEDCSCPDFFRLGDKHVLLCISHAVGARAYVGTFDGEAFDGEAFRPERHVRMNWPGGMFFAPESLAAPDGRRLFWAWVTDPRVGPAQEATGSGFMSLPRVMALAADGTLLVKPAEEMRSLRGQKLGAAGALSAPAGPLPDGEEVTLEGVRGAHLELALEIDPADARQVGVLVRCSPDGAEQTGIWYDAEAGTLSIDMSRSTLRDDVTYGSPPFTSYGLKTAAENKSPLGAVVAPFELRAGERLRLDIFLDGPMLEVFANDRQCVTQVIWPKRDDSTLVKLAARGAPAALLTATAWPMRPLSFTDRRQGG